MDVRVREATESDGPAISEVMLAAFREEQGRQIAALIADLLADPGASPLVSLVAMLDDRVIGHVLFTRTRVDGPGREVASAILAPLAVHPEFQRGGVGGRLIAEGLERLGASGVSLVFVLGDPGYYGRFGFAPAGVRGLDAPHPLPPEYADAWMVRELRAGTIGQVRGRVECAGPLNDPKHWIE